MKYINPKKIKVGEHYFFPDTYFNYSVMFKVDIKKERINKIIGGEFSTRNEGDRYEQQRFIGFLTEQDARKYLIKRINERKRQIIEECKTAIKKLKQ